MLEFKSLHKSIPRAPDPLPYKRPESPRSSRGDSECWGSWYRVRQFKLYESFMQMIHRSKPNLFIFRHPSPGRSMRPIFKLNPLTHQFCSYLICSRPVFICSCLYPFSNKSINRIFITLSKTGL